MILNWDKIQRLFLILIFCSGLVFILNLIFGQNKCCWLFLPLWVTLSTIYLIKAHLKISPEGRAVLITGCDTGFGHAAALHLDKLGFVVFAGCLSTTSPGASKLKRDGSERLHLIQLNITSEQQIKEAFIQVKNKLPPKGLWGIVNNAGWSTFGELEWVPMVTFHKIFEINLFGMIKVLQTFLPLIRKSQGRVVNMASGIGIMSVPMRSAYITTKYAVEGLSDCLRYEMKPWNVHVSVIEPGNYIAGTNIYTQNFIKTESEFMWNSMSDEIKSDYGEKHFQSRVQLMNKYSRSGLVDISPVVEAYTEGLMQKYPQERYQPMDFYFKLRSFIARHFPEWVYDNLYIDYVNLEK